MVGRPMVLWSLVALNAAGILLAGLSAQGFEFHNSTAWTSEGPGLDFGAQGLAYTDAFTTHDDAGQDLARGFTVEMALRPAEGTQRRFRFIAVIHSGEDESQLLIAQWRDTIIVMNGDDYDHRRRLPRLTAAVPNVDGNPFLLAVRSDARGSALYIDGVPVDSRSGLTLELPTDGAPGRLVLGNSVYGGHPWKGTMGKFALYPVALSDEALRHHFESWERDESLAKDDDDSAALSFSLAERTGHRAADRSGHGLDLQFPPDATLLRPKLFAAGRGDRLDTTVNLLGFMPFGFVLAALLATVAPLAPLRAVSTAIAIGFTLSLGIESAQAWIPSRSSSLVDLLLNGAGAGVGGAASVAVSRAARLGLPQ